MYPLLMQHPKHGATHVYNGVDESRHRAEGWVEFGPPQQVAPHTVAEVSSVTTDGGPPKKRRGRPPKVKQ